MNADPVQMGDPARQYCLLQLVREQAERNPNASFILAPGRRPLTYGRLSRQVEYVLEALHSLSVSREDCVAMVIPDGPEMAVASVAITSGAVCAPLNPAYRASEMDFYLGDLNARALIVLQGYEATAAAVARSRGVPVLELIPQAEAEAGLFTLAGRSVSAPITHGLSQPDDAALALYTSGTAARPKRVRLTHQNICVAAHNICAAVQLTESDRCLSVMPLFHIHGLSTLFASLAAGASVVYPSGFSAAQFFECLDSFHPTWYSAAPTIHQIILENAFHYPEITARAKLRFIRSASAAMPLPVMVELERLFRAPFIEAYGMTEASPQIASNRLPPHPRKAGSVGRAAGPAVAIWDELGNIMPPGEPGEIVIRGANVAQSPGNDTMAKQDAFVNGWFRTGDIGYMDMDGYLFVTGSLKEIINRGGEKISPREVDQVLMDHPAVSQAVTFKVPHPVLGENVAAAVVLKPDFQVFGYSGIRADQPDHLIQEIRSFVATHLAYFKVPDHVVIVDDIPKGPTGKLERANLARQLRLTELNAQQKPEHCDPEPLRSLIEQRLVNIWAGVLKIDCPGIHDNFFLLGGHSLAASQVVVRLRDEFQVDLPVESFFKNPTIAQLAKLITRSTTGHLSQGYILCDQRSSRETLSSARAASIPRRRMTGPLPLSFAQHRLWFLEQFEHGNIAYNMSASLWLKGRLNKDALEQSLNEIRRRHEILRTTFHLVGGQPVQVIVKEETTKLPITDLTMLPPSDRKAEALRLGAEEVSRPFDLAHGPLFRTALIGLDAEEHILLLTMHHIISDGWSMRVLHRELAMLYEAFLSGCESPLPELAVQYGDFAVWQRGWLQGEVLEKQIAYWKEKLQNVPPVIGMPTDRPRPSLQTYRGGTLQLTVSRTVTEGLKALSVSEKATLFMTLLAAFQTLLFRYTGQSDLPVGVPIANRPCVETEPLIGFFANTLVMRNDLSGNPLFRELLARVRITAMGAYAHQDLPFEKVVEVLQPERDPSHGPLFQVMFAFQNLPDIGIGSETTENEIREVKQSDDIWTTGLPFQLAPGLSAHPFRTVSGTAKFDLTLYLAETKQGLEGLWKYNIDLFEADTIERVARHFKVLLEGIVANPERRLSEFPLLDDTERRQQAVEWNRTENSYRFDLCLHHVFEDQVSKTPNALAVECGDERFTYDELNSRANQLAWHLKKLGVGPEKLVGIILPRSAEMAMAILGVLKAGGAFLPLDPEYPSERLVFMMRDAKVSVLITGEHLFSALNARPGTSPWVSGQKESEIEGSEPVPPILVCLEAGCQAIDGKSKQNPESSATETNLAYVIYTSGSIGSPKGVMITHANLCHYVHAMREALGIMVEDRYLHTASFAFSSSIRQFLLPLSCGAAVVIATTDQIHDHLVLFDLIREHHVSILDVVPSYWRSCIQMARRLAPDARAAAFNSRLRLILSASETLSPDIPAEWASCFRSGAKLINMYGLTETTGIVSMYHIHHPGAEAANGVPIGRPIENTRVYILDALRQLVPVGVYGEVYIGGAGVGRGYLNQQELTAERFVSDPFSDAPGARLFRTGDTARYLPDGNIVLIGRYDSQIKLRGFLIQPGEIEAALRKHPWVGESAVITPGEVAGEGTRVMVKSGMPATGGNQKLVAFVVPRESVHHAIASEVPKEVLRIPKRVIVELRESLKRSLPGYMVPSMIVALKALPLTPNGKLDRKALSALAAGSVCANPERARQELLGAFIEPRTHAEKTLADIWRQVLNVDRVGIEDNFFELGGDSLLSIQVISLANRGGLQLTLKELFQYQTVIELARISENAHNVRTEPKTATASVQPEETMAKDAVKPLVLVTAESLRAYGREALERAGLSPEGAAIVTEVQLEASLRGQRTHNMDSIPRYARRISSGVTNPQPRIRIEHETSISARIDGDNGPGQWVGVIAMRTAIQKAKQAGMSIVSARRSNHFGAAAHYVWLAVQQGLIGLCTTNGPVILAPTGGVTPTFGNNPLGVGIPASRYNPILLDIAMSVAPRGKIGLQLAEGKMLPPGWILDHFGRPSTDPADLAAGLGVPIGGHKGYGLALVMEAMAGVLSGAGFCHDHSREQMYKDLRPPDFGHFFMVIDPELFMSSAEFMARVDRMIEQTKSGELAQNAHEILIPGEAELRARERNMREGVPLLPSTYRTLLRYGEAAELDTKLEVVKFIGTLSEK